MPSRRPVQNRLKIRNAEVKIAVALVRARILRLLQQGLHLGSLLCRLRIRVFNALGRSRPGRHRLIKVAVRFSVGTVALRETLHLADIKRQISAASRLFHVFRRGSLILCHYVIILGLILGLIFDAKLRFQYTHNLHHMQIRNSLRETCRSRMRTTNHFNAVCDN